jgi:hypothetical protein
MSVIPFGASSCVVSSSASSSEATGAVDLGGPFPWIPASDGAAAYDAQFTICNVALADIRDHLRTMVMAEGRVHVETYLAATGALAGFAAQRGLFHRLSGLPPERRVGQVMVATTKAGEKFFFGDRLNDALIARREAEKRLKIWPLALDAAISSGMKPASAPKLETLFGYVAGRISEPFFPSPEKKPGASATDLLTLFWPLARQAFDGRLTARARAKEEPGVVSQHWRPAILALLAQDCLLEAAQVMTPAKALTILMESAIYGSKVDPVHAPGEGYELHCAEDVSARRSAV